MKFSAVIWGRPIMKKGGQKVVRIRLRNGRVKITKIDTPQYKAWKRDAILQLRQQLAHLIRFKKPVNAALKFFFNNHQSEPDLETCYGGIQDIMQSEDLNKMLADDKLIYTHDGSGKFFGYEERIEIEITELTPEQLEKHGWKEPKPKKYRGG